MSVTRPSLTLSKTNTSNTLKNKKMEIDMQTIEEYLLGELSLEDKIAFEQALSADADLRDKVTRQHAILRAMGEARVSYSDAKLADAKALLDAETGMLIPWRKIAIGLAISVALGLALYYFSQQPKVIIQSPPSVIIKDTIAIVPSLKDSPSIATRPKIRRQEPQYIPKNEFIVKDTIGIYLTEKLKKFGLDVFAGRADDMERLTNALTNGRTLLKKSIENARKTNSVDLGLLNEAVASFDTVLLKLEDRIEDDKTEKKLFYRALYYKAIALTISDPENAKKLLKQVEVNAIEEDFRLEAAQDLKKLNEK